jgi:hypothetical protein
MSDLMQLVDAQRDVGEVQLTRNIISSYTFIDYALIKSYSSGIASVTLAHTIQGKPVVLTNVEVLSHGSKAFSTTYTLVEGDVVQLFSSRSMIDTIAGFTEAKDAVVNCYDIATIKAFPITDGTAASNKLDIADDGSLSFTGSGCTVTIGADGTIDIKSNTTLTIEAATKIILKSIGTAAWCPNGLTQCLWAGVPHGGPAVGIIGLSGS